MLDEEGMPRDGLAFAQMMDSVPFAQFEKMHEEKIAAKKKKIFNSGYKMDTRVRMRCVNKERISQLFKKGVNMSEEDLLLVILY